MTIQPKDYFMERLVSQFLIKESTKILEFGSGQSKAIIPLLERFPNLYYVGVEPSASNAKVATDLLRNFKNAKIFNQLAYNKIEDYKNFDICISLSVLEHVKQLERFLINSIEHVKQGGYIIHRYDLGHALYPSSVKEKFQVYLGNNFPGILPENKFVRYLEEKKVCEILENNGARIEKITYHQMPNHKRFLKLFNTDTAEKVSLAKKILEWEYDISKFLYKIDQKQRELLFPAVTVWAIKK